MARFTVEDCLEHIPNRFNMTLAAALRARQIEQSGKTVIEGCNDDDKPTVKALYEIAANLVPENILDSID